MTNQYERDVLRRIRDQLRRYRHLPGWLDGFELGDWTVLNRLIDPTFQPTRTGVSDPQGTYPDGSRVIGPEDVAALERTLLELKGTAGMIATEDDYNRLAAIVDGAS